MDRATRDLIMAAAPACGECGAPTVRVEQTWSTELRYESPWTHWYVSWTLVCPNDHRTRLEPVI